MRAGSTYLLPENIYGKVELEPYFKMEYSYATVEFKIGMEQKYVLKNISAFYTRLKSMKKSVTVKTGVLSSSGCIYGICKTYDCIYGTAGDG